MLVSWRYGDNCIYIGKSNLIDLFPNFKSSILQMHNPILNKTGLHNKKGRS